MVPGLHMFWCPSKHRAVPQGERWGFLTSHRESGGSATNDTDITCRTAQHLGPWLLTSSYRCRTGLARIRARELTPKPFTGIGTTLPAWALCVCVCVCVWQGRRWQDSPPRCLHSPLCTSGQNPFALASCRARRFGPLCCGAEETARNCQPC